MSRGHDGPTVAERLAEFVATLRTADLPPHVRDDARWRVTDTLGVAIAGSRMESTPAVLGVVRALGGVPEASVIGVAERLPAPLAGLANATLAHTPDYDDTHSVAMVHISSTAVPSALAAAERGGASGADFMTAVVIGGEVGVRVGAAVPHRFSANHFHPTAVCGTFAAAAAGSRLLGNGIRETANAFGIAASQSTGLLQGMNDGSWIKRLHPGSAVFSGLLAALLAQRGFTGPREIFEGSAGLYATLLHGEPYDAERAVEGIGSEWMYPETVYKLLPNGAWNHSAAEGARAILAEHALSPEDVERIDCWIPVEGMAAVCDPRDNRLHPQTPYHMKFSLYYTVAMLAVLGRLTVDDYNEEVLADRRIADFAQRVYAHGDEALEPNGFPARVRVRTRAGEMHERAVPAQPGSWSNPLTPDQHHRKFLANAAPSLGETEAEALFDELAGIWSLESLEPVVSRLRGSGSPPPS